ncbi:MAG: TldD/PmbA family protein [Candidatus Cloacimonetes bacterium]|nr:TldD/PmbA family protein [Candidatus Cloacimonadota bacterium]
MDKLIKMALEQAEQAEVYYTEESSDGISFNDGKLDKADSSLSSGLSLRLIKDGKVGFAHTRNLLDPAKMVKQAMISQENGMEVKFSFPKPTPVRSFDSYDPSLENISKKDLIQKGQELISYVKARSDAQINLNIWYSTGKVQISNSQGTDLSRLESSFGVYAQMIFPGTGSGLVAFFMGPKPGWIPVSEIDEMIELFRISKEQVVPQTGKLPVIFQGSSVYALTWRLDEAIHPSNHYNKISPLCNRIGERIISDKLSYFQNPFDEEMAFCAGFDEEGTPTSKYHFFEKGVFKAIPTDLNYAQKLGLQPTGNGFRHSVETMPGARVINANLSTGDLSLKEMIAQIDNGLIVQSLMGAHSGNILNGDFSVGVASGFLIQGGKLVGRVKDCMLSGNVYDTLNNVVAIEN